MDQELFNKRLILYNKLQNPSERPVWTKKLLKEVEKWFSALDLSPGPYKAWVIRRDAYDQEMGARFIQSPKELIFNSFSQLAFGNQTHLLECIEGFELCKVAICHPKSRPWFKHPKKCCRFDAQVDQVKAFEESWNKSRFALELKNHIKNSAKKMVDVRDVLCFGLGKLKLEDPENANPYEPDHIGRTWLQHVAARLIQQVLQEEQGHPINLIAQGPDYCPNYKFFLRERDFWFYDTPRGFETIEKDTFIVTKAPTVPVRQIVGDLTSEWGGPAGILCDLIREDWAPQHPFVDEPSQ